MLVLSRRLNESIVFPYVPATVQVLAVKPGTVRLGVKAPPEVAVYREEVWERMRPWPGTEVVAVTSRDDNQCPDTNQAIRHRFRNLEVALQLLRGQLPAGLTREVRVLLDVLGGELQALERQLGTEKEERTGDGMLTPSR